MTNEDIAKVLQSTGLKLAPNDLIRKLQPYVRQVLSEVDKYCGGAWYAFVSNESKLEDFLLDDRAYQALSDHFGVPARADTRIWSLAAVLAERQR